MKKFVTLLISFAIVLSLAANAAATDSSFDATSDSPAEITNAEIARYALNYMRESQQDHSLEISNFIPLYDLEDNETGYYLTFSKNGVDAGYILLSLLTIGSPVVEFSFEGNGPLNVSSSPSQATTTTMTASAEKYIYVGPDSLFIPMNDGTYYSVYDRVCMDDSVVNEILNETQIHLSNIGDAAILGVGDNIYDGIIDWSEANIDTSTVYKIKNFGAGTDYWLMSQLGSGGVCAPTAATNILWYWGFQRGCSSITNHSAVAGKTSNLLKARAIFQIMYNAMGTTPDTGTSRSRLMDGFSGFFGVSAQDGGVWNYKLIPFGSSYWSYTTALYDDCPILLSVWTSFTGVLDGKHSMFCLGHARSTNRDNYLFVMDGWNTYGRFVKHDYYPNIVGYKIWVR